MLLQRLAEYADRTDGEPVPVGYNLESVWYWVELGGRGDVLGIVAAEQGDTGRPKKVAVPTLVRSYGIKPKLLADNGPYTLGVEREGDKADRVRLQHEAFVTQVAACAAETGEPAVGAVLRFLQGLQPDTLPLPANYDPRQTVSFLVDGVRPTDLAPVRDWWARVAAEGRVLQCLICGRELPAMDRIQLKVKGIPGKQTSGLALISANSDAFESYGLKASHIAPTCQACSDRFMKGANALIGGQATHLYVGDAVYVFWTRQRTEFSFTALLSQPEADQVRALLQSAWRGRPLDADPNPFYAAVFSASGSRAVVRGWIETTVDRAAESLARFFALQQLVDDRGGPGQPYGVLQLARATRRAGDTAPVPAWLVAPLVHTALAGGPLPWTLLWKAVERCRVEQGVSHARAALIKMVLMSNQTDKGGDDMSSIDIANRDPAYLCGRLFAELEAAQVAALGRVGASIVDRFYGTASSAPATVFGRLLRGAQPHLGKLRRDRPPAYHAIDRRLQDILGDLAVFPTTLSLQQQGMFALGYYHQRADDRRAAAEHSAEHTATEVEEV